MSATLLHNPLSSIRLPFGLRIKLDGDRAVYPGSVVKGSVKFSGSLKNVESFGITLNGRTFTSLSVGVYGYFEDYDDFLTESVDFLRSPDTKKGVYQFTFSMPVDAPPSCKLDACWVKYTLKAEVKLAGQPIAKTDTVTLKMNTTKIKTADEFLWQRYSLSISRKPGEPEQEVPGVLGDDEHFEGGTMPQIEGRQYVSADFWDSYGPTDDNLSLAYPASSASTAASFVQPADKLISGAGRVTSKELPMESEDAYKMYLDLRFPTGGIYTDEKLPFQLFIYPTSPMPYLYLRVARIGILATTWIKTKKYETTSKQDYIILDRRDRDGPGFSLPPKSKLDYTNLFEDAEIPDLVPQFETKLLRRHYRLFLYLTFSRKDNQNNYRLGGGFPSRLVVRMPIEILGRKEFLQGLDAE